MSGIVLSLLFISCDKDEPIQSLLEDDYEVYSQFIEEYVQGDVILNIESYYWLGRFTLQENYLDFVLDNYPVMDPDLVGDLTVVDQDSILYENQFKLNNKQVELVTSDEMSAIFNSGLDYSESWELFLNTYGEDAYRLSLTRVAFNEDRTKAMFCASKGHWAYYGYIVYCEKVNDEWVLTEVVNVWVT